MGCNVPAILSAERLDASAPSLATGTVTKNGVDVAADLKTFFFAGRWSSPSHRDTPSQGCDAQWLRHAAPFQRGECGHRAGAAMQWLRCRLSSKSNLLRRSQRSQRREHGSEKNGPAQY